MGMAPTFIDVASPARGTIYGLHGWRGDHLYGATENGEIIRYDGVSWNMIYSGSTPLYAIWVQQTPTGDEIFAVGSQNTVLHKAPAATTFDSLRAVGRSGTVVLRAIAGFDGQNLLVAGDAGTLLSTANGGMTWRDIALKDSGGNVVTAGMTGLWRYGTHAFLVSDGGHLFHTADRGATFKLESMATEVLNAVGGADLSMVVAVGRGMIRKR
jgi:photosystem II stability/assembly factor-like uncharacterized protein